MNDNRNPGSDIRLPAHACISINHCNLPCHILGSLHFQQHPQALYLDGVQELHHQLFDRLAVEGEPGHRAILFVNHMKACFQLDDPQSQGYDSNSRYPGRFKSDYRQLLQGWLFTADGLEAAVIKAWVESRFGLQTRNHRQPIPDHTYPAYALFQEDQSQAMYNTNALHPQLDVLYSYCQYELRQRFTGVDHLVLYRGLNRLDEFDILASPNRHHRILLLNNINSFSGSRDRADEFGDQVINTRVPLAKLLFVPGLIPGLLQGEEEHMVIGGLYQVTLEGL